MVSTAGIQVVREAPKMGRTMRQPKHHYTGRIRPFEITPFLLAPVLPGETMSMLMSQANVEGPGVASRLAGWWYEQYFFYVKHRDLEERDLVTEMHLNAGADVSSLRVANDTATYNAANNIDWTRMCLNRVVDEYFRDEGEGVMEYANAGLPLAAINNSSWLDSAIIESAFTPGTHSMLPGENEDVSAIPDNVPAGFETQWEQWQNMRAMQLTDATFEDYLKSFGVKPARELREDLHRPELIRYIRDWQYPVPTNKDVYIDPPGEDPIGYYPRSMMAPRWKISERADKDRFFSEPGFIFGVMVMRPKVYLTYQTGSAAGMMDNAFAWLPSVLSAEAYTSLRKVESGTGSVPAVNEDWWFDVKDLLVHGDQFIMNRDLGGRTPMAALPSVGLEKRYLTFAQILSLLDATDAFGAVVDGVVQLGIKSRVTDTSL